jgi:hypothetical protein
MSKSKAIWRAITTVNAPLPIHITPDTLVSALLLETTDEKWQPHVQAFFREVAVEVLMDLVVEGTLSFDNLAHAIKAWAVDEEYENAGWVREMAPVAVAKLDGANSQSS